MSKMMNNNIRKKMIASLALIVVILSASLAALISYNSRQSTDTDTGVSLELGNRLTWAPPEGWESYQKVTLAQAPSLMRTWNGTTCTSKNNNLIIELPKDKPHYGTINLEGGGNIVIIGGEVQVRWTVSGAGSEVPIPARRAIKIADCQGQIPGRIVHIEGVKIGQDSLSANCSDSTGTRVNNDSNCSDLSEGIQIAAPNTIVQLQNIRINHIHARDQVNFDDNHPDLIQPYGGYGELRIDKFTGSTDYQGFYLRSSYDPIGTTTIKRTNINGDPTARQLFWVHEDAAAGHVFLEDLWGDVPANKSLNSSIWPNKNNSNISARAQISFDANGREVVRWPTYSAPTITGFFTEGTPPTGDFVKPTDAGFSYVSPGYGLLITEPEPTPEPEPQPTPEPEPEPIEEEPEPTVPVSGSTSEVPTDPTPETQEPEGSEDNETPSDNTAEIPTLPVTNDQPTDTNNETPTSNEAETPVENSQQNEIPFEDANNQISQTFTQEEPFLETYQEYQTLIEQNLVDNSEVIVDSNTEIETDDTEISNEDTTQDDGEPMLSPTDRTPDISEVENVNEEGNTTLPATSSNEVNNNQNLLKGLVVVIIVIIALCVVGIIVLMTRKNEDETL